MRESMALHSSLAPVMVTAIRDRACGVHGCPSLLSCSCLPPVFSVSSFGFLFLFSFSRGIWRFSRLTFLGWLALRRRPGAPCLLGASGGQLQRPLLLFLLLPFFFFFILLRSATLAQKWTTAFPVHLATTDCQERRLVKGHAFWRNRDCRASQNESSFSFISCIKIILRNDVIMPRKYGCS